MNYQKEIEKLEQKIAELKVKIDNDKQEKLHLAIDYSNYLHIIYKDQAIGYIDEGGQCYILSSFDSVENYEQWREDGMPFCHDVVKWRGGEYCIDTTKNLKRKDIASGNIYSFNDCMYYRDCEDNNIKRFKHNNRPIGY